MRQWSMVVLGKDGEKKKIQNHLVGRKVWDLPTMETGVYSLYPVTWRPICYDFKKNMAVLSNPMTERS